MKITKYVHSCLLVETEDRVTLFDPGVFSWKAELLDIDSMERLDRIVITHPHGDHLSPEFVKALVAKFPEAHIIANQEVQDALSKLEIKSIMRDESDCCKSFVAPHEKLPLPEAPPLNTGFHFKDMLTHPGDSHHFDESKDILALPIIAPWGSTVEAVELAVKLKPKHIIPIHDWHYSDAGRNWLYALLEEAFEPHDIVFHSLKSGEPIEI